MGLRVLKRKVEMENKNQNGSQKKVVGEVRIRLYDDATLDFQGPSNKITMLGMIEFAKASMITSQPEEKRVQVFASNPKIKPVIQ